MIPSPIIPTWVIKCSNRFLCWKWISEQSEYTGVKYSCQYSLELRTIFSADLYMQYAGYVKMVIIVNVTHDHEIYEIVNK